MYVYTFELLLDIVNKGEGKDVIRVRVRVRLG